MIPTLLHYGIHPRIASATSSFNYFWMALSNMISLFNNNSIPFEIAGWFLFLAFIGGSVVTKIGYYYLDKYKMSYIAIFIVFGLAFSNIISGVWYLVIYSNRFGFSS